MVILDEVLSGGAICSRYIADPRALPHDRKLILVDDVEDPRVTDPSGRRGLIGPAGDQISIEMMQEMLDAGLNRVKVKVVVNNDQDDGRLSLAALRRMLPGNMVVRRTSYEEYRVNFLGGNEDTAFYTTDSWDAYYTAKDMAHRAPVKEG